MKITLIHSLKLQGADIGRLARNVKLNWSDLMILRLLNTILPPRCPLCGTITTTPHTLCVTCWNKVSFITPPFCAICGLPFDWQGNHGRLCLKCAHTPPLFDQLRSLFIYDDHSKDMVLAFKHGDRCDLAPTFARWFINRGHLDVTHYDYLLPVPLHWRRLGKRRYNQAGLLCHALSKLSGIPTLPDTLKRIRPTQSQGHLSPTARQKNLSGAFGLNPKNGNQLTDMRLLLVDDVFTTGATLHQCCRALRPFSPAALSCLTLSRVVQTGVIRSHT